MVVHLDNIHKYTQTKLNKQINRHRTFGAASAPTNTKIDNKQTSKKTSKKTSKETNKQTNLTNK